MAQRTRTKAEKIARNKSARIINVWDENGNQLVENGKVVNEAEFNKREKEAEKDD